MSRRPTAFAGAALCAWATAGCPLILGGPDLSHVDAAGPTDLDATGDADADTDADADADADADSDADTDTAAVTDPDAPVIVNFGVLPLLDRLGFSFVIADANNDLEGGSVHVTNGVDAYFLLIPDDLHVWDPLGQSIAYVPGAFVDCDAGYDATWTLTVTDDAGHAAVSDELPVTVTPYGHLMEQPSANDLGVVSVPFVACVGYEGSSELQLILDSEQFRFTLPVAGPMLFQLGWVGDAPDLDLFLYDRQLNFVGASTQIGVGIEEIRYDVLANEYTVDPAFRDRPMGTSAPFVGVLLALPE